MENSKLRVCRRQSSCGSINEDMEKLFQRLELESNIWKKRGIGIQSKKLTDTVCSIPYLPVWSRNVNCLGSRKAKGAFEMWC
ncbi:unnamed protein product [Pieris macdunnoughi]|uniref:Uncharacterized protein n=1 Tax=Pieris macdunnoughi TaxID=345717 RepID=A0A821V4U4_9NEOP|nr:unnamed protein product [Pieris macdunnoughi]